MKKAERRLKRIVAVILSLAMVVTGSYMSPLTNVVTKAAATEVSNPRTGLGPNQNITEWDCVYFGRYQQSYDESSDSYKVEPIKWRVLSVDGNDAFVIADKGLDKQPYNTENEGVTWEDCSVRTWLNDTFYNDAFNDDEQAAIIPTDVTTDESIQTQDNIYLLSSTEALEYDYGFDSQNNGDDRRYMKLTDYAIGQGALVLSENYGDYPNVFPGNDEWKEEYKLNGEWWLRSSAGGNYVHYVFYNGLINNSGNYVSNANYVVRPVMHIDITSDEVEYAGTVQCHYEAIEESSEEISEESSEENIEETTDNSSSGVNVQNPRITENSVTWDCIYFGNYKQTCVDFNVDDEDREYRREPIKWRILSVDGNDAFVIADQCLDGKYYNTENDDVTWADCTLRSWLNGYSGDANSQNEDYSQDNFINIAFDEDEKQAILDTTVETEDNAVYGTDGGENTFDKVYLPSIEEMSNEDYGFNPIFNAKDSRRVAESTDYAWSHTSSGPWWLRSPGYGNQIAIITNNGGYGSYYGFWSTVDDGMGVRPVMHIDLSSDKITLADPVEIHYSETTTEETTVEPEEIEGEPHVQVSNPRINLGIQGDITEWDCIYLGNYLQSYNEDNQEYNNERIKWRVLSVNGNDAFVMADQVLDCKQYAMNQYYENNTVDWSVSSIRSWLNGYDGDENLDQYDFSGANDSFIDKAFTDDEKNAILSATVVNTDNAVYGTEAGENTTDKIYLLSLDESINASYGFESTYDGEGMSCRRYAKNTDYAISQGVFTDDGSQIEEFAGNSQWWLRTPGRAEGTGAQVFSNGSSDPFGGDHTANDIGVRPVMHVNLTSDQIEYAGTVLCHTADAQGQCGDDVFWSLDFITGKMTISGSGEMWDFDLRDDNLPTYHEYRDYLKDVVIEDGVTSIGRQAFNDLQEMESISIPASVVSIFAGELKSWAIEGRNLERITVDENNPVYDSRNDCNAVIETETNVLLYGCNTTVIPDDVVRVGSEAFFGSGVTQIDFPASVESIGFDAFMWSGLESVYIPETVLKIEKGAFSGTNAQTMEVHPDNPNYDSRNDCDAILRTRLDEIIAGCNNTVIPDTARIIGIQAMQGIKAEYYIVPKNIEIIKQFGFQQCPNLHDIVFLSPKISFQKDNTYQAYEEIVPDYTTIHAYRGTSAEEYTQEKGNNFVPLDEDEYPLDEGEEIQYVASSYMAEDVYFTLNRDNGELDVFGSGEIWGFEEGYNPWQIMNMNTVAQSITIGEEITSIGSWSFSDLINAQTLQLPESLEEINWFAFDHSGIEALHIPENVRYIGAAFQRCSNLASITVDEDNQYYDSRNDCNAIMNKDGDVLDVGCMNTIIPDDTTGISWCAFYGATGLTSIEFPESLIWIGRAAFEETGLVDVTIPETLGHIDQDAFKDCDDLEAFRVYNRELHTDMDEEDDSVFMQIMPTDTVIYGYRRSTMDSYHQQTGNPFVPFDEPLYVENPRINMGSHRDITEWDCIYFGNYPQSVNEDYNPEDEDSDPYNWERIRWRVLDVDENGIALVMADRILDAKAYNDSGADTTWENSSIRSWLNGTYLDGGSDQSFYDVAFDSYEKDAILTTAVKNDNNPEFDTNGGNDTDDKVYLLSIDEASNTAYGFSSFFCPTAEQFETNEIDYFEWADCRRRAYPTEYAIHNGAYVQEEETPFDDMGTGHWWLRSPGDDNSKAAIVYDAGHGQTSGHGRIDDNTVGVRPVMRINLNTGTAEYAGTEQCHGNDIQVENPRIEQGSNHDATEWDCIYLGNYPQSVNEDYDPEDENSEPYNRERIKWRVLSVDHETNQAFVVADQNLDCRPFNTNGNDDITWETSTLRSWLNGYSSNQNIENEDYSEDNFKNKAFSKYEQNAIVNTHLENNDNPYYNTSGGNDTDDDVYLLSMDDASNRDYGFGPIFKSGDEEELVEDCRRYSKNTDYAASQGAYTEDGTEAGEEYIGNGDWWLRSPGSFEEFPSAGNVFMNGQLFTFGHYVGLDMIAVRPAMVVDLNSCYVDYAGTVWCHPATVDGQCGDDVYWSLDLSTGTMRIYGNGDMWDFEKEFVDEENITVPWNKYGDQIKDVVIEEGVTSIGREAFNQLWQLESLSIPASVTYIPARENAWIVKDNHNLTSITIDENNPNYYSTKDGFDYNAIIQKATEDEPVTLIYGCNTTIIPDEVVVIAQGSFHGSGITEVDFPASVEVIEDFAFPWSDLEGVFIPKTVLWIGEGAFSCLNECEWMEVEEGNPVYDSREDCDAIIRTRFDEIIAGCKNTVIPDSVRILGRSSFQGLHDLENVTLKTNIEIVKGNAFMQCDNLTDITFLCPKVSLETDSMNPGHWYEYYADIVPEETTIHAYRGTTAEEYADEKGNTFVPLDGDENVEFVPSAYMGTDVYFTLNTNTGVLDAFGTGSTWWFSMEEEFNPFTAMRIEREAESIVIEEGVTYIGGFAFGNLVNASTVSLPDSLEGIGDFAFYNTGLESVHIPENVEEFGERPFGRCSNLAEITVDENNETFDSRDNCNAVMSTDDDVLVIGCKNTVIPEDTTGIGNGAYFGATGLTELNLPDSVGWIDNLAFAETGLAEVDIPETVGYIGEGAFDDCEDLETIKIYNRNLVTPMDEEDETTYLKIMPVTTTIYGYKGSTMQSYANQTGNPFVPFPEYCTITINDEVAATVLEGEEYTFPVEGEEFYHEYGYLDNDELDNAYRTGATIVVERDMDFTGIDSLSAESYTNGASVRFKVDNPGISFGADAKLNGGAPVISKAFTFGMLMTAFDFYSEQYDYSLTFDSLEYSKSGKNRGKVMDITFDKGDWISEEEGYYRAGIIDIADRNISRSFLGRAYAKINYTDGTSSDVMYSTNTSAVRSIKEVSQNIQKNNGYYNSLNDEQKTAVDAFAQAQ